MIQLIVGLANPGPEYSETRHNAGAWLLESLAESGQAFRADSKMHGLVTRTRLGSQDCRLLIPTTYMNHSGQAVAAMAKYYKIPPTEILVAHDELDLPAGQVRLKQGGGHGGHNGLRDIISHLGSRDFLRLRVGIGRPKPGSKEVVDFVLSRPAKAERQAIDDGIHDSIRVLDDVVAGKLEHAMKNLHTK